MNKWVLAGCGLAITLGAAAEAAVLVVRSSGPSAKVFPAGRAVPDNQVITLKNNDVLILLDSRGTRTLRGPGKFSATASSASAAATSSLAALTGQSANRRSRVGAVRRPPTGATAGRNVWQADVARSGNICIVNPADLGLYRANGVGAAQLTVTDLASGKSAAVKFAEGQKITNWPAGVPVAANGRYRVASGGDNVTYTARMIEPVPAGLEGLAQTLIRNDCQAQLDVLIDTFASPTAS